MSELNLAGVQSTIDAVARPRRVILFGRQSVYQDALKYLLESRIPQTEILHVSDEQALLQTTSDLIVFDVDVDFLSDARAAELTETLQRLGPRPVLLLSSGLDPAILQRFLRDGVAGVVLKSSPSETLIQAIESVSSGKVWLQRDLLSETFGESSHVRRRVCSQADRIAQLTQREREIIAVAASGCTNRQVSAKLNISEATVRHHLSSIFGKLAVANRGELIVFAYRHGLADEAERHRLC